MTSTLAPPSGPATTSPRARPRGGTPKSGWRALAAAGLAGGAGLISALAMPRGPVTPTGVVVAVLTGVFVGIAAGYLLRSRWAMLLAPVAFVVANELARIHVVGPTVDRPNLTLFFGVLAFVLGRVLAGILQLLPMVVGAAYGAGLARQVAFGPSRPHGWHRVALVSRRAVAGALAVALLGLGFLLTRPGSTAPITGPDGKRVPGSVAELTKVRLGGHDQTVLIRARDVTKPVLLYLAGGPGQSDLGYTRAYMKGLENDVVFAVWDQRGTGTSYAALDPTSTWTLDRAVADTVELTNYLRQRFSQQKIYVFGNSWGTIPGVLAVQRHPELYAAFVGSGQMVSVRDTDQRIYRQMLDYAARTNNPALAQRMRAWGQPPYRDIYANAFLVDYYDKLEPYTKTRYFETQGPAGIDGNGASEYGPLDKINKLKAMVDMGRVMYPQLQALDFRRDVPALGVPVYLVQGGHELSARSEPAREWLAGLQAPTKQWITLANSGHIPQFEEFDAWRQVLTGTVLPETSAPR